MTTPSSEQILVTSAMKGDLEAFNQLVLKYQDIAYYHASALVDDPDQAEDVAQESFIKAFQNIGSFRGGSFRVWLLKIVTNASRDYWRRILRHPTIALFPEDDDGNEVESPAWIADPAPSVERTVQHNEQTHQLYRMLAELPAAYRSIIMLIDVYELDYLEAAEILHIPLGTVKSRLIRARLRMKNRLQGALHISRPLAA